MKIIKSISVVVILIGLLVSLDSIGRETRAQVGLETYPFQAEDSQSYSLILGQRINYIEDKNDDAVYRSGYCNISRYNLFLCTNSYTRGPGWESWIINYLQNATYNKDNAYLNNFLVRSPNISVSYYAGVSDKATGTNLSSGDTISIGTDLEFEVKPFESEDIEWLATGAYFDTPYGHWVEGAGLPDVYCQEGDKITHSGFTGVKLYTPFSVNPPDYRIEHSGTAQLSCDAAGWNCTVESPGSIISDIIIDETYGHYYTSFWQSRFYHYCFRNTSPLAINSEEIYRTILDDDDETFTHVVPEQIIHITLNAEGEGSLPAPAVSGPTSGVVDKSYTFTIEGTHPEDLPIRFGIDWINNIFTTVNEYTEYTEDGSQDISKSYSTTGKKYIHAISQDEDNLTSPSSETHTINIGPRPDATLEADETDIEEGESTTLTWSSDDTVSCDGINFSTGGDTDGTSVVSPITDTEYSVECVSSYDPAETATSFVYVSVSGAAAPVDCSELPDPVANATNPQPGQTNLLVNQSVTWSIPGTLPADITTPAWSGDSPLDGQAGETVDVIYTTIGKKTGTYKVQDALGGVCEKTGEEIDIEVDPDFEEV